MCGIIGFVSKEKRADPFHLLVEGLKNLEYRGYDSWGIAYGRKPFIYKKVGKVSEVEATSQSFLAKEPARAGVAHTRWATHGGVTVRNAHPHLDCKGEIIVAHNGIVENWEPLKKELIAKRHRFSSETDTEVISHLLEEELSGGDSSGEERLVEAAREVFNRLEGLNAVVIFYPKENLLIAFRDGSSLVVGVREEESLLASDVSALIPYTNKVVFLEDREGVILSPSGFKIIDSRSGKIKKAKIEETEWVPREVKKGRYPHFLIKEIEEQPRVLAHLSRYPRQDLEEVAAGIKNSCGTYIAACGTAAHAGLAATYLFSHIGKRQIDFSIGSEFRFLESFLEPGSLLIAASQSGETVDTLEAAWAAKRHQSSVFALTNSSRSSLARLSDKTLSLACGPEKAVLATKSYTAKLGLFLLLAYLLDGKLSKGRGLLLDCAERIPYFFTKDYEQRIRKIAKGWKTEEHLYVIGRGVNYPTALEAALKIKEVSYLHAEGFAGGELKHGVIALIEEGTPCLVFAAGDEVSSAVLSNAKELKSRGARIVGVSPKRDESFDDWIRVPDVKEASPIVNIVPAQLLAYHLALARGLDPDKPRNLAKSVTVR